MVAQGRAGAVMTGLTPDRARRRIQALLFGVSDMTCVEVTAEHLLEGDPRPGPRTGSLRRTVEAGLVVVYARPFIESRGLPRLSPAAFDTEHLRGVHAAFLEQRHQVYAHTDETAYRDV